MADSDSDGAVGPMPAPAGAFARDRDADCVPDGVRLFLEREARVNATRTGAQEAAQQKATQRPDWMLTLPEDDIQTVAARSAGGPVRARGFLQTGQRVQRSGGASEMSRRDAAEARRLWTETEEQRRDRAADPSASAAPAGGSDEESDILDSERIAQRNAAMRKRTDALTGERNASLVELHREQRLAALRKEAEHLPPFFDKDKVLGAGSRLIDERGRSKALADASDLSGRFASGTSGSFL
ncbi:hypothetical protein MSPP1_001761 [Malassezia sp. CBS 17886]|nr:hypothetical protein MSPP1_001761 [Malassezia sp. CBS 17886]